MNSRHLLSAAMHLGLFLVIFFYINLINPQQKTLELGFIKVCILKMRKQIQGGSCPGWHSLKVAEPGLHPASFDSGVYALNHYSYCFSSYLAGGRNIAFCFDLWINFIFNLLLVMDSTFKWHWFSQEVWWLEVNWMLWIAFITHRLEACLSCPYASSAPDVWYIVGK